jgi:hypothetical protein
MEEGIGHATVCFIVGAVVIPALVMGRCGEALSRAGEVSAVGD